MISSLCLNMRKSINHKRKSARRRRLTPIGSEALPPSQGIHRDNHFDSFLRQRFAGACTRLSQLQHAGDRARLTVRRVSLGGASSLPGFRAAKWCGDIDRISCDSPKPLSGGCTDEASPHTVIASAAKQSIARHKERMDCFVALLLAMTASAARGKFASPTSKNSHLHLCPIQAHVGPSRKAQSPLKLCGSNLACEIHVVRPRARRTNSRKFQ